MKNIRILFFGDIVGKAGRAVFQKHISRIKSELGADAVILNGENSSQGRGITSKTMKFFKHNNVNVVTSGNHIWKNKEIYQYLDENRDLLRPANYPSGCPGVGVTTFSCKGNEVAVVNLQGRVFMRDHVDCPFRAAESILTYLKNKTNIIIVDFHAEASSEKMGMGHFLNGKVSAVIGTHTHVQTADERILSGGTAYITDVGMAGSWNSMIGVVKEQVLRHLLTQMPVRFTVDTSSPFIMTGVLVDIDMITGKANGIKRLKIVENELSLDVHK